MADNSFGNLKVLENKEDKIIKFKTMIKKITVEDIPSVLTAIESDLLLKTNMHQYEMVKTVWELVVSKLAENDVTSGYLDVFLIDFNMGETEMIKYNLSVLLCIAQNLNKDPDQVFESIENNTSKSLLVRALKSNHAKVPPELLYKFVHFRLLPQVFSKHLSWKEKEEIMEFITVLPLGFPCNFMEREVKKQLKQDIMKIYLPAINPDINVVKWWNYCKLLIHYCGKYLHTDIELTNAILRRVETGFKTKSFDSRSGAYECWKVLIENYSTDLKYIQNPKQIKLLLKPLKVNLSKHVEVAMKSFDAFATFIQHLQNDVVCLQEFLSFCFGPFDQEFESPASNPKTPISPGRLSQNIYPYSTEILLKLMGHDRNTCLCKNENTYLTDVYTIKPLLNIHNINEHNQVFIDSVRICSLLAAAWTQGENTKIIISCLWNSLLRQINGGTTNPAVFKNVLICVQSLFDTCVKYDSYFEVLNGVLKSICNFIDTVNFEVFICDDFVLPLIQKLCTFQSIKPNSPWSADIDFTVLLKYYKQGTSYCRDVNSLFDGGLPKCSLMITVVKYSVMTMSFSDLKDHPDFVNNLLIWVLINDQDKSWKIWKQAIENNIVSAHPDMKSKLLSELKKTLKEHPQLNGTVLQLLGLFVTLISRNDKIFMNEIVTIMLSCYSLHTLNLKCLESSFGILKILIDLRFKNKFENSAYFCNCFHDLLKQKAYAVIPTIKHFILHLSNPERAEFFKTDLFTLLKEMGSQPDQPLATEAPSVLSLLETNNPVNITRGAKIRNMVMASSLQTPCGSPKSNLMRLFNESKDKIFGGFLDRSSRVNSTVTNAPRTSSSKPSRIDLTELSDADFVRIDAEIFIDPSKLNEHQKEVASRRRDDIPALYEDLTQSSMDALTGEQSNSTNGKAISEVSPVTCIANKRKREDSPPEDALAGNSDVSRGINDLENIGGFGEENEPLVQMRKRKIGIGQTSKSEQMKQRKQDVEAVLTAICSTPISNRTKRILDMRLNTPVKNDSKLPVTPSLVSTRNQNNKIRAKLLNTSDNIEDEISSKCSNAMNDEAAQLSPIPAVIESSIVDLPDPKKSGGRDMKFRNLSVAKKKEDSPCILSCDESEMESFSSKKASLEKGASKENQMCEEVLKTVKPKNAEVEKVQDSSHTNVQAPDDEITTFLNTNVKSELENNKLSNSPLTLKGDVATMSESQTEVRSGTPTLRKRGRPFKHPQNQRKPATLLASPVVKKRGRPAKYSQKKPGPEDLALKPDEEKHQDIMDTQTSPKKRGRSLRLIQKPDDTVESNEHAKESYIINEMTQTKESTDVEETQESKAKEETKNPKTNDVEEKQDDAEMGIPLPNDPNISHHPENTVQEKLIDGKQKSQEDDRVKSLKRMRRGIENLRMDIVGGEQFFNLGKRTVKKKFEIVPNRVKSNRRQTLDSKIGEKNSTPEEDILKCSRRLSNDIKIREKAEENKFRSRTRLTVNNKVTNAEEDNKPSFVTANEISFANEEKSKSSEKVAVKRKSPVDNKLAEETVSESSVANKEKSKTIEKSVVSKKKSSTGNKTTTNEEKEKSTEIDVEIFKTDLEETDELVAAKSKLSADVKTGDKKCRTDDGKMNDKPVAARTKSILIESENDNFGIDTADNASSLMGNDNSVQEAVANEKSVEHKPGKELKRIGKSVIPILETDRNPAEFVIQRKKSFTEIEKIIGVGSGESSKTPDQDDIATQIIGVATRRRSNVENGDCSETSKSEDTKASKIKKRNTESPVGCNPTVDSKPVNEEKAVVEIESHKINKTASSKPVKSESTDPKVNTAREDKSASPTLVTYVDEAIEALSENKTAKLAKNTPSVQSSSGDNKETASVQTIDGNTDDLSDDSLTIIESSAEEPVQLLTGGTPGKESPIPRINDLRVALFRNGFDELSPEKINSSPTSVDESDTSRLMISKGSEVSPPPMKDTETMEVSLQEKDLGEKISEVDTETMNLIGDCQDVMVCDMTPDASRSKDPNCDTLYSSPVTHDTPTKNNELLNNTIDISPIKVEQVKQLTGRVSPDIFESQKDAVSQDNADKMEIREDAPSTEVKTDAEVVALKAPSSRSAKLLNLIPQVLPLKTHKNLVEASARTPQVSSPTTERIKRMMLNCEEQIKAESSSPSEEDEEELLFAGHDILKFEKEVPSPLATPKGSILKRKFPDNTGDECSSPSAKRKRVNFSDPPTTSEKIYFKEQDEKSHFKKMRKKSPKKLSYKTHQNSNVQREQTFSDIRPVEEGSQDRDGNQVFHFGAASTTTGETSSETANMPQSSNCNGSIHMLSNIIINPVLSSTRESFNEDMSNEQLLQPLLKVTKEMISMIKTATPHNRKEEFTDMLLDLLKDSLTEEEFTKLSVKSQEHVSRSRRGKDL